MSERRASVLTFRLSGRAGALGTHITSLRHKTAHDTMERYSNVV